MIVSNASTNRQALLSFIAAMFTLSSFCVGLAPLPLTAWVCYPLALLSGSLALFSGFRALRQVRASGEKGRALALVGIWTGALTIVAVVFFTTLTVLVLTVGVEALKQYWPLWFKRF